MKERALSFIKRWRTLLIVYLLVFLLPFLLASMLVQRNFLGEATTANIQKSATELSTSLRSVDELFREMQVLVGNMKYDTSIAASYHPDQLQQIQRLMAKLKTVHASVNHYDHIWYYCQGDTLLCSDITTHSTSFFNHRYQLNATLSFWDSITELEVRTAEDLQTNDKVVLFILPFSKITNENNRLHVNRHYMIFCVQQDWFEQLAKPFVKQSGKMELILNNQVVLEFSNTENSQQLKGVKLPSTNDPSARSAPCRAYILYLHQ